MDEMKTTGAYGMADYGYWSITGSNVTSKITVVYTGLGSKRLSHKELQRLTPAERAEYARYRSKHHGR